MDGVGGVAVGIKLCGLRQIHWPSWLLRNCLCCPCSEQFVCRSALEQHRLRHVLLAEGANHSPKPSRPPAHSITAELEDCPLRTSGADYSHLSPQSQTTNSRSKHITSPAGHHIMIH